MKRSAFLFVALLFIAQSVLGATLNPTFTGSWYNPNQNGHGLSVEVMDHETTLIYWYVYHTDGTPMFLITVGSNNGNTVTGPTYYQSGMKFGEFDPNDLEQVVWGEATFTVHDCQNATFSYSLDDPAYGSGSVEMVRLTSITGVKCVNFPLHNTYHLTFGGSANLALGTMWVFENGYSVFYAANEIGLLVGIGESKLVNSSRYEIDFRLFDVNGGTETGFAAGSYSSGYINASFDAGLLVGTAVENFQSAISNELVSTTYDITDVTGTIGTLTLTTNGTVSGRLFNGCDLEGEYVIPNRELNQIYMELDTSGCSYQPEAIAVGNVGGEKSLFLAFTDGWYGNVWLLKR